MKTLFSKTLKDVCEFIVDCLHNTAPIQDEGYPLIRTPNIGRGNLLLDDVQRVSNDTYKIWTRRATPQKNDLILAREAPAGNVALIRDGQVVCLGQRTVHLRPNSKQVNPYFLCIYLLSPKIQAKLLSGETGATSRHVNMKDIRKLAMDDLPDLTMQNTIASIIESYSVLIDTNRRRIQLLEESARLLFREWFVYFKFPGHEKVKIVDGVPEGWEKVALGNIANRIKKNYSMIDEGLNLIDLSRMNSKTLAVSDVGLSSDLETARIIFEKDDVLFSSIRPYLYKVVLTPFKGITNTSVFVVRAKNPIFRAYITLLLFSDYAIQFANVHSTGTKMPVVKWGSVSKLPALIPPKKIIEDFQNLVWSMLEQIQLTYFQNQRLAQARDLLLPRLMSGAIEV